MIAAIFDVDRTLVLGTSMEQLFLLWQLRHGHLGPWDLLRAVPGMGWQLLNRPRRGYVQYHGHLAGKREEDVEEWAERCFAEEIVPRISSEGMRRVAEHQAAGHLTVLLSGSIQPLVKRMSEHVGADLFVCTVPELANGRYTGRLVGKHVGDKQKAVQVAALAAKYELELAESYCYADHHTDLTMLDLFGHPTPTNPDRGLARAAQERGWEICRFR